MKFLCVESCLRYCPIVTGFSGWVSGAWPTLSLGQSKRKGQRSETERKNNNTVQKHLKESLENAYSLSVSASSCL